MKHFKFSMKKFVIGMITGISNGLFGSGGGTILVPAMEKYLDSEEHKAHATAIAVILPLSIISMICYFGDVHIHWDKAMYISIGGVIGGFVGALLLKKLSGVWIHRIFGIFMIIAAVRMLF